eukprot:NODE_403_length_9316_cov_0.901269.p1 type:complete len:814 gc:universal NODE_403_length_9316_cov_0.901269:3921-6362(+)
MQDDTVLLDIKNERKEIKKEDVNHQANHETIVIYRTLSNEGYTARDPEKKNKAKGDPAEEIRNIKVHKMNPEEVAASYGTNASTGLDRLRLARLEKYPKNVLSPPKINYAKKVFWYVFGGFNVLMWVAMILSILSYQPLGSLQGNTPAVFNLGVGILLLFVVCVSAIFYGYVDFNASQAMKAIKHLVAESAAVTRHGERMEIDAADLRIGDLVHLSLGQRVPADIYLLNISQDAKFDRSILTGESDLIQGATTCTDENPLETRNLALSSTFLVQGTATGIVFATGDNTVVGQIFKLSMQEKEKRTILQLEIDRFTYIVSIVAVASFCISMLFWGVWTRRVHPLFANAPTAIINSIGCLTALVPQGLPVCVALALTIIARRMASRKVLVKNLSIVETVGAVSVLCSDKTGTLTQGKMCVDSVYLLDAVATGGDIVTGDGAKATLKISYLCNDAQLVNNEIVGNSTDAAVYKYVLQHCDASVFADYQRIHSIPFNSKSKYMLVIVRGPDGYEMHLKGAPDVLISLCSSAMNSQGNVIELAQVSRDIIHKQDEWSRQGQRVIMTCYKLLRVDSIPSNDEKLQIFLKQQLNEFTITSLIGITDPPREDVKNAVNVMRSAGVRVMMVTGDFKLTAESIAKQVGILTNNQIDNLKEMQQQLDLYTELQDISLCDMKPDNFVELHGSKSLILNGSELLEMSGRDWDVCCSYYNEIVFARTSPEQKMRIVQEFKLRGDNVVGVTGDGVNDAPALKAADVGLAMGSGSDVSKEAAAMVLLENDFASIPVAIENGRLVFENLRKVTFYVMPTGTYTEMMAVIR